MGVTFVELRALRDAVVAGAGFDRTVTLGRHWLLENGSDLMRLVATNPAESERAKFLADPGTWADNLFRLLGAVEVISLDVSDYEGATIVHDLNTPIPAGLMEQFDFVFDGGTIEHVFDVRQALTNLMELAHVGGYVLSCVPANNMLGHGFYQFSPELYYRVFSKENGYEVVRMTLTEAKSGRRYEVIDPAKVGRRIEMFATAPTLLLSCLARRTADIRPFARPPQQSDYSAAWSSGGHTPLPRGRASRFRAVLVRIGERWFPRLLGYVRYRRTLDLRYHPDLFRPLQD